MKIIEYYSTDNQQHWLSQINESDWGAGKYLYTLLKENKLTSLVGEDSRVYVKHIATVDKYGWRQNEGILKVTL